MELGVEHFVSIGRIASIFYIFYQQLEKWNEKLYALFLLEESILHTLPAT
jgi:hypothetical protein